jgi:hypothetical protein
LEVREPLINTVVLVSSSLVIWLAERALHRQRLGEFRAWWLLPYSCRSRKPSWLRSCSRLRMSVVVRGRGCG